MELENIKQLCTTCCKYSKTCKIEGRINKFCRNCLREHIKICKMYPVKLSCFLENETTSNFELSDYICYQILSKKDHAAYNRLRVDHRVIKIPNLHRCYNLNCSGTVRLSDSRQIICNLCKVLNCYDCKAVHEKGETCNTWKEKNTTEIQFRIEQQLQNEEKIRKNQAIYCPSCGIFIGFMGGCDWICCPVCKHEICFRTKMSRWGPGGRGDTSDGCKCKIDGVTLCHPNCNNCH